MIKAPIALFVYKRPHHTEKTLESLSRCEGADESELFIFCDGPKRPEDMKAVEEVRGLVKSRKWRGKVNVIERDENWGLANSIISGVTELCERYGRVIVLEDDLIVSRYFLEYMNNALDLYENSEQVMQVSGHMYPVNTKTETDAVLLPWATSWGWGTWNRAWNHFDKDMKGYTKLKDDATLRHKFDLDGSYPYYKMLGMQRNGKIDSWAIRWYLSIFMSEGVTLFPTQTLIQNIGFDGSGTHCTKEGRAMDSSYIQRDFHVLTFPPKIEISEEFFAECKQILKNQQGRLVNKVKGILNEFVKKVR